MSNRAVENMFQHKGKTVNIIGKTRIKTYRDLYLQLSDLQKNKEIPNSNLDSIAPNCYASLT